MREGEGPPLCRVNFSRQAVGLELPWLLPGCAASPFTRKVSRGGALEPAVSWAGQVSKVVTLVIASGSSSQSYVSSPSKDSAAECWSSPTQVCLISKPMFCLNTHMVTGETELSGPKMNCVRGRTRSWRELEEETWSAGGVRQDHSWSHPRDQPPEICR